MIVSRLSAKRVRPSTLGGRLVAVLALFISLVTIAVIGIQFAQGRAELTREVGQRLAAEADLAGQRLARDVRERVRSAAVWSQLETAQDVVTDDIDKRLATTLERLVTSLGPEDVGLALNDSGRVIAVSRPSLLGTRQPAFARAARACGATLPPSGANVEVAPGPGGLTLLVHEGIHARGDGRSIGCLVLATPWSALVRAAVPAADRERVSVRRRGSVLWQGTLARSGVPVMTGRASVAGAGIDFEVEVAQSRADALSAVRERGVAALLLALAVMVVALPAAYIVARSTAEPLRALTESALALTDDGSIGLATPAEDAPREVRVLHAALDSMLQRLDHSRRTMAEREALASLGTMAASLAHEIRTPLAVLQSSAQLLVLEGTDERRSELTGLVLAEVQRLDRLVSDLLTFSRPRAPDRRAGDLRSVVQRAAALLEPLRTRHGVILDLALDAAPAWVDEEQFQQVVLNLASNAVQFSPRGATVRIATCTTGEQVELTVTDSGPGIDADRLAAIWKPFHTSRRGGTGLGLPIVRQIVERHDGTIVVTSELGVGTTVRVSVPIRPLPTAPLNGATPPAANAAISRATSDA